MQIQQLGSSRTSHQSNHLFQTPDSFVRAPLPGMQNATAIIHAGPALGAGFLEYTAEMKAGGKLGETAAQRFFYVVSGAVHLDGHPVAAGGYGFVPQGEKHAVTAAAETQLVGIEKRYEALGDGRPRRLIGGGDAVIGQPLMGDEDVQVQPLIPDSADFDFAVNLMTFAPGAALCMVEAHIMEHGLMMLQGGGIYRLGDFWYPTTAGDFIWMAPYCPQWFGAIGKIPAKYLIYKNWNRHPL
jgi:(S)-ureidoglycine aminohydrolase